MALNKFKSLISSQLLRIAGFNGHRVFGNGTPQDPNHGIDPLSDNEGKILFRNAGSLGYDDSVIIASDGSVAGIGYDNSFRSGQSYQEKLAILPPSTVSYVFLQQIYGFNISGSPKFLQLLITAPYIAGNIPIFSILVPASANFSLAPMGQAGLLCMAPTGSICGQNLGNSASLVSSTTGDVYTPSGSDDFYINYVYRSTETDPFAA